MSAEQNVITAAEVETARAERKSLLATFSNKYGIEPQKMMATLRATVIRPNRDGVEASNEQIAAFLIVANQHGLNPFTKEIHAFADKRGGIVVAVGIDGWAKKMNEHPQFNGLDFEQDDEKCTCVIHRKDREHPTVVTEFLSECKRPNSEAWNSHPKRMLRHRAMAQCARLAFSFSGFYEPDEAEGVLAAVDAEVDVTPAKIAPVRLRTIIDGLLESTKAKDGDALRSTWNSLTSEEQLFVWEHLRSWERSSIKKLLDAAKSIVAVGSGPSGSESLDPWAVEALKASASPEALATTWRLVEDSYSERDQPVPADVEIFYSDRKGELEHGTL